MRAYVDGTFEAFATGSLPPTASRYHALVRVRPALKLVPAPAAAPAVGPARELPRPSLDDLEIVSGVLAGDASVATAFHDRARPRIDATVVRLLGCREPDHDDTVQNALIALVASLARFRGECSLDTWIARVTAHVVWKELRRRTISRRVFDRGELDVEACEGERDPETRMAHRSDLVRIRAHFDAIDPIKAWTLMLHDVAGFDLREVAEITDASVAAAQSRLVRGRRELEDRLAADPDLRDVLERRRP